MDRSPQKQHLCAVAEENQCKEIKLLHLVKRYREKPEVGEVVQD